MILETLRENPKFRELEQKKMEAEELKQQLVALCKNMDREARAIYDTLERDVLNEIDRARISYRQTNTDGIKLAKGLCHHGIHPWAKTSVFTNVYYYHNGRRLARNPKSIPKYYIEYCPICGEVFNTSKRRYRFGKREMVNISYDEFEMGASEFGYSSNSLERYTDRLPDYVGGDRRWSAIAALRKLEEKQTPEVVAIIEALINYLKNDGGVYQNTSAYQEALEKARELCKIFGHDVRNVESKCQCCGEVLSHTQMVKDYQEATLSGVIDFPYLHRDYNFIGLDEESQDALGEELFLPIE